MSICTSILDEFRGRGIVILLDGDSIGIKHPTGSLTDDDAALIRRHKQEIVGYLRSHCSPAEAIGQPDDCEPAIEPEELSPVPSVDGCQFCGESNPTVADDPEGIRCDTCGCLTRIESGVSQQAVAWHDHDMGAMSPDDIPVCESCNWLCDTQLASGEWRCSRCDPNANARRQKKIQLMELAEKIRSGKQGPALKEAEPVFNSPF